MKIYEERKKIRRSIYSKPVLFVLVILIVVLGRAVWYSYLGRTIASENLQIAALEKQELEERVVSLQSDLDNLETERGMEEAIRSKFGVAKEGEEVIVLVDPDEEDFADSLENKSLWDRFLNLFKNN